MIYLDNASTTYKKPWGVYRAGGRPFANSGRGGHKLSLKASSEIEKVRSNIARFFGVASSENIAFCPNATFGLNYAIHGFLQPGDHVIISGMEHNAVSRPAFACGAEVSIAKPDNTGFVSKEAIQKEIKLNTKMIAITHASNVTGTVNPIREIGKLAHDNNIVFLVDSAQTAGILPINVFDDNIDLLAFPSHKHLYGMQGSGGLYVSEGIELGSIIQGGTGTYSMDLAQTSIMPNMLESGTQNAAAIVAMGKGMEFIQKVGLKEIRRYEEELTSCLLEGLLNMKNLIVYEAKDSKKQVGTISFNILKNGEVVSPNEVSNLLSTRYDIATRAGFHCAALAHKTLGTKKTGAVRASVSYFTKKKDIEKLINAICKMKT